MKKILPLLILAALYFAYELNRDAPPASQPSPAVAESVLQQAYANRQSDVQVRGVATVVKVLRDDLQGSRHQRFIVELTSGQTLLVSHNIDLAPRVEGIRAGDRVEFYGEYEWNDRGGVIHWTHHDPAGRHAGGWLKHKGQIYQ
jgi:hypothetical protein